jgi:adenine-specific DNA methylase
MIQWKDYFTQRQALALATLSRYARELGQEVATDSDFSKAVQTCIALAVSRQVDYTSSLCTWHLTRETLGHTFTKQALPMIWDFVEVNPFSGSSGDFSGAYEWIARVCEANSRLSIPGQVEQVSATNHILPDDMVQAVVTDPPYYFSVQYADLSDYFYVWLKRTLLPLYPRLFEDRLTPKENEIIVQSPGHEYAKEGKNNAFYEERMTKAMQESHRILSPTGIGVVVFAHKSTKGWESQLQSMVDAGWTVTGSWPIDTEMAERFIARNRAVLASSIHLVCRPRITDEIGDWRDVLHELPGRINAWLPRLAQEGVVGADAIFACLGPALEIFSRYGRVEKASGEIVTLGEYLEYVWAAVSREALNMVFAGADTSGFEEDARLTAMWLWTLSTDASPCKLLEQKSDFLEKPDLSEEAESASAKPIPSTGYVLEYDAARKIAQGLGAHLEQLGHLIEISGSNARLLPVTERTRYLFGQEGLKPTNQRKRETGMLQLSLLDQLPEEAAAEWRLSEEGVRQGKTMLDRVHQTMLLFAAGRSDGLKSFLVDGGLGQDERFWRLAQALSALYPVSTDEKRWVDGVLARKKGLGF